MKFVFACLLLLTTIPGFAQTNPCDSIVWKANRPLTWNDYKAKPDSNSIAAAYTNSGFVRTWSARNYKLYTVMVTNFNPCLSWRKGEASARLLAHEQLHFDITECYKRVYYRRVSTATYTPATLPDLMSSIYQSTLADLQVMQREYDLQTKHSLDEEQQAAWKQKIVRLLRSLKPWDRYQLIVELPRK
ncbi:hypothetical protein [Mucilaginibacter terrae]|uniref:DUF922 domain-containing protein n=1 Tax=Mucilaginibacter terrae TaxID=1955052 RepID=A0ABU3GTB0_9SPHI|nr:hypothetical protein [Mucilaginibacter terrae]MDT3403024.1 hypothetical protein [Mucilaginibacter terrae]